MTPLPADAISDSVGVNTHLSFGGISPYQNFDTLVRPMLRNLGVRYVRDQVNDQSNTAYYAKLATLAGDGIKFSLILFDPDTPASNIDPSQLATIVGLCPGAIFQIEGSNEPDNLGVWANGGAAVTCSRQQSTCSTIKGDPVTFAGVSVLGPGLAFNTNYAMLGNVGGCADYGNGHSYPGGTSSPELGGRTGIVNTKAANVYGAGKSFQCTESGYHTALGGTAWPVPEFVRARWLPRLILTNLLAGWTRTFLYELISSHAPSPTDPSSNFGLVNYLAPGDTSEGVPHPSFWAIKNLIDLFNDPGPAFTPTALTYTAIASGPNHGYFTSALFQDRHGGYKLAAWFKLPSVAISPPFSTTNCTLPPYSASVTVTLPATVISVVAHQWGDDGAVTEAVISPVNGVFSYQCSDSLVVFTF